MPTAPAAAVAHLISNFLPLRLPWDSQVVSISALELTRVSQVGHLAPTTVTHN